MVFPELVFRKTPGCQDSHWMNQEVTLHEPVPHVFPQPMTVGGVAENASALMSGGSTTVMSAAPPSTVWIVTPEGSGL